MIFLKISRRWCFHTTNLFAEFTFLKSSSVFVYWCGIIWTPLGNGRFNRRQCWSNEKVLRLLILNWINILINWFLVRDDPSEKESMSDSAQTLMFLLLWCVYLACLNVEIGNIFQAMSSISFVCWTFSEHVWVLYQIKSLFVTRLNY